MKFFLTTNSFFFLRFIIISSIISIVTLLGINEYNKSQINPTIFEIKALKETFGDIDIKSKSDIFRISNNVVSEIKHQYNLHFPINIINILQTKKGQCYDRSLILQKIFYHNKIPIRPVFLYYYSESKKATVFNLFDKKLLSHNIFEFKYQGKWYVMSTNKPLKKLQDIEQYISSNNSIPSNTKYIRYLNNRNSKFIYPSWIPDIYWIN